MVVMEVVVEEVEEKGEEEGEGLRSKTSGACSKGSVLGQAVGRQTRLSPHSLEGQRGAQGSQPLPLPSFSHYT